MEVFITKRWPSNDVFLQISHGGQRGRCWGLFTRLGQKYNFCFILDELQFKTKYGINKRVIIKWSMQLESATKLSDSFLMLTMSSIYPLLCLSHKTISRDQRSFPIHITSQFTCVKFNASVMAIIVVSIFLLTILNFSFGLC